MTIFDRLKAGLIVQDRTLGLLLVIVILVIAFGVYASGQSQATDAFHADYEAESGVINGNASIVRDSKASGGRAVLFGSNAPPPGDFPNQDNTGVPNNVQLATQTGQINITSCDTVIDSKIINGDIIIVVRNGTHSASTPCVTIKNSRINGQIYMRSSNSEYGPLVVTDSEINYPKPADTRYQTTAALVGSNFYAWRSEVQGGTHGIHCDGYCEVYDSYIHNLWANKDEHLDAFTSNGNDGKLITLDHNTLQCNYNNPQDISPGGGCSSALGLYGDFGEISDVRVTDNFFVASIGDPNGFYWYCAYTGADLTAKPYHHGTDLKWINNTFQRGKSGKCGEGNPVYPDWANNSGNVWSGNKFDDGAPISPASWR